MGILQLPTPLVGQGGLKPASKKMVSSDDLATITAAGYLNAVSLEGYPLEQSDHIEMLYDYSVTTGIGVYAEFNVNIVGGVITLTEVIPPGGVTRTGGVPVSGHFATWSGPDSIQDGGVKGLASAKGVTDNAQPLVVSVNGATTINHVAKFSDIIGTVQDGGVLGTAAAKAASDNTKPTLASVFAATTVGHVATFADIAGTVQDGGALGQAAFKGVSDNTKANVSSVFGATVVGNVLQAADINGTVQDGGIAASNIQAKSFLKAQLNTTAITGGSAGPYTVPAPGLSSASIVVANLQIATNNVAVRSVIPALNTFDITFTADPGVGCQLSWIALIGPQ